MTPLERRQPELIDTSRRRRIARGAGTDVAVVNQLLRQHEQMRQMMKKIGGGGMFSKLGRMFGGGGGDGPAPGAGAPSLPQRDLLAKLQRGAATAEKDPDREAARRAERKRQKEARKRNRRR